MSTKKTSTAPASSAAATAAAATVLSASYLRNASESQLVSRLLDIFTGLEAAALKETASNASSLSNAAGSPKATGANSNKDATVMKVHKEMLSELVKREYLTNPNPDVQVAVACSLACAIGGGPLAARGAPNPIPKDLMTDMQCLDVLKLIVNTIQRLQSDHGKTSYHSYIRQLMEKLAARHGIHALLTRLMGPKGAECDETSELLFQVLLNTTVEDDAMIGQMAAVICDVIEAYQALTDTQMQLLLTALTNAVGSANPAANTPRRVALAVLRRKEEVVASAVGGFIVHEVEAAVEEMAAADVAAIDDASEEATAARKQAVKRVGAVLESSMAVCRVGVSMSSGIIPRLQQNLNADHNDIRLIFTRTFARIFQSVPSLAQAFTPAYHSFLNRFSDARVPIRAEMLKYAKEVLSATPLSDDLWSVLANALENKLVDSDESIRRSAIAVVVDLALIVPRRIPNKVYANLAARCKDKTPKVRAFAIERLSELFLKTRLKWIPNAIFASAYIAHGADASLIEFALSDMIPKPADDKSSGAVAANRKKQTTLMEAGKQRSAYKFDFEGGNEDGEANDNAKDDKSRIIDPTFLGGFIQLCECFDDANWELMLTLMHKKAQFRLTVLRLVEIRQALKAKTNVEANKEAAVRIINFLTQKTHSEHWGAVFREADDTATKWLQQLCDANCKDYFTHGEVQLETKVKGRTHNDVHKFLVTNVLKRLCLPFSEKDVAQLVAMIDGDRRKDPSERIGAIRALEAIVRMSPQLALATATPQLAKWVKEDSEAIRRGQNPELSKVMRTSLRILSDIATLCSTNNEPPKEVMERKNDIIATLGKICLSSEDGAVAKRAALSLTSLFKNQTNAFQQLMIKVQERLAIIAAQGESAINPTTIALVRTFGAFAANCPDAIVVSSDLIAESVTSIMMIAVRAHRDEDDVDAIVAAKKNPNGHSLLTYPCLYAEVVDACAKALTRHALSLPGHSAAAAVPELFNTLWKAFRETQSLPTGSAGACKRRLALHKQFIRLLFKGESIFAAAGIPSVAVPVATRKGKNGNAATSAVVSQTTAGNLELMRKELSVVTLISSEDNDEVRHAIQAKLKDHILKSIPLGTADTRKVAMLCMTAIAEDGKAGYTSLKSVLAEVAERLSLFKVQQKVTLSDSAKAWRYFLEYAVPPLVTYMAHHTTYTLEKEDAENPFKHFQRPWQLLFDEMLKDTTESASALQEMFRKLRSLDDAVPNPPEAIATRVICDLGCKVLLTILGEKSVASGAPFPGSLLVPWYFAKPADGDRYPSDMVFLPSDVQVTARPLFGLPVGFLAPNNGAAANNKPSQSVARGASRSMAATANYGGAASASVARGRTADNDADEGDDNANVTSDFAITPTATPAKTKAASGAHNSKRGRADAVDDDLEAITAVSPQPKLGGAAAAGTKKALRTEPEEETAAATKQQKSPAKPTKADVLKADAALMAAIDVDSLGFPCPSKSVLQTIVRTVSDTIAKYPPSEIQFIKFGEIRVAVQEALGRKWSDGEKEYAKRCVVAMQTTDE